ncbi:oligosaccharide flippase family protein [Bosea sp. TAB14]|uniref:oligosaccharide flippase family protein n=1 Tax=Bosea sp. TAB14 TaxID=3237481 RepID=UPI003F922E32
MHDLKSRTVRAGLINVGSRGIGFTVRIASLMILGRLLTPEDYGLVTMVTAFTGVLNMFGCFGLFQAAIQREELSEVESSSLFWLNLIFGALLTLIAIAAAPLVSAFYNEPRLLEIMDVIAFSHGSLPVSAPCCASASERQRPASCPTSRTTSTSFCSGVSGARKRPVSTAEASI